MEPIKTILHITPFFSPNIGGVETHLDDLIKTLDDLSYQNIVLTYSPLTTITKWKNTESFGNTKIYRFNWIGHNLFHRLEKYPLINFLYITPYLLIRCLLWQLINHPHIDAIHSHGLNAAIIGNIYKKIFNIPKHIVSIYSTYDNVPLNSRSTEILISTLNKAGSVLTQSNQSITQLINLGVNPSKVFRYFHWIDLERFAPINNNRSQKFNILFVGRMIPQKNALLLANIASLFPKINFDFIGTGPDFQEIQKLNLANVNLLGDIKYSRLQKYYQQASVLCVPSKYAEGWGRVLAESVACGTPVISTNLGATTEAIDESVGIIISPTKKNIVSAIKKLITSKTLYDQLQKKCRPYAIKHYSKNNISYITKHY